MTPRERVSDERLAPDQIDALEDDLTQGPYRAWPHVITDTQRWLVALAMARRLARIEAWAADDALPALDVSRRCAAGAWKDAGMAFASYPTPEHGNKTADAISATSSAGVLPTPGRDAPAPEASDADSEQTNPRPDTDVRAADAGGAAPIPRRSGVGDDRDAEGSGDAAPGAAVMSEPAPHATGATGSVGGRAPSPQRFRKRPVVIEAWCYETTEDRAAMLAAGWPLEIERMSPEDSLTFIETLEGRHRVTPGDWVIRGVAGEFYPCRNDIFAATYEPAEPTRTAEE